MSSTQKISKGLNESTYINALITPEGSKCFIKKLVQSAVAYILFQRIDFDKDDFMFCERNGIEYVLFKPQLNNIILQQIQKWLSNLCDSIDKEYLHELYLLFSKAEDPNCILESYKFQFKYIGKSGIARKDLKKSTKDLLNTISLLNQHTSLVMEELDIKMVVTYYEEETPDDYNIPSFEPEGASILNLLSSHSKQYLALGRIQTTFHTLKCRGKSDIFNMDTSSTLNSLTRNVNNASPVQQLETVDTEVPNVDQKIEMQLNEPETESMQFLTANSEITNISINNTEATEIFIYCICGVQCKFDNIDILICSLCSELQHYPCEGFLEKKSAKLPEPYICSLCEFCDISRSKLDVIKFKAISRLVIAYMHFNKSYCEPIMAKLSKDLEDAISEKLRKDKVVCRSRNKINDVNFELISNFYIHTLFRSSKMLPDSIDLCQTSDGEASEDEVVQSSKKRKRNVCA